MKRPFASRLILETQEYDVVGRVRSEERVAARYRSKPPLTCPLLLCIRDFFWRINTRRSQSVCLLSVPADGRHVSEEPIKCTLKPSRKTKPARGRQAAVLDQRPSRERPFISRQEPHRRPLTSTAHQAVRPRLGCTVATPKRWSGRTRTVFTPAQVRIVCSGTTALLRHTLVRGCRSCCRFDAREGKTASPLAVKARGCQLEMTRARNSPLLTLPRRHCCGTTGMTHTNLISAEGG